MKALGFSLLAAALLAPAQDDVAGVKEWWGSFTATLRGEFTQTVVSRGLESVQTIKTTTTLDRFFSGSLHLNRANRGIALPGIQEQGGHARNWSARSVLEPVVHVKDSIVTTETFEQAGRSRRSSKSTTVKSKVPPDLRIDAPILATDTGKKVYHLHFPSIASEIAEGAGLEIAATMSDTDPEGKTRTETVDTVGMQLPVGMTGDGYRDALFGAFHHRPLPADASTLTDTVRVKLSSEGLQGDALLLITWTLRSKPPPPVKLVVVPPKDYASWRPEGHEVESVRGNRMEVTLKIVEEGRERPSIRAKSITARLHDATREPGVCLNWPEKPAAPPPPDLQFSPDGKSSIRDEGLTLERAEEGLVELKVAVDAFDWGGFAQLQASALLETGQEIHSVVEGQPGRNSLAIPKSDEGSWIASAWKAEKNASGPDDADAESDPQGEAVKGDGLTLYEEYRGFRMDGRWWSADPNKKDLFIHDPVGGATKDGIRAFAAISGLEVHDRLSQEELGGTRVINRHHGKGPHRGEQHGILFKRVPTGDNCEAIGGPGIPRSIDRVELGSNFGRLPHPGPRSDPEKALEARKEARTYWTMTLAHELFHCVNVYHHGDLDPDGMVWDRGKDEKDGVWKVWRTDHPAAGRYVRTGVEVRIFDESGAPIRSETPGLFEARVGNLHGEHSGYEKCVMRYDFATHSVKKLPAEYFELSPKGIMGSELCTQAEGVDFNKDPRTPGGALPKTRFGSADTANQRGRCRFQIHVNDSVPPANRSGK